MEQPDDAGGPWMRAEEDEQVATLEAHREAKIVLTALPDLANRSAREDRGELVDDRRDLRGGHRGGMR
jgi:hypothetical protein